MTDVPVPISDSDMAGAVRAEMARRGHKLHELVEVVGLSYPTISGRLNSYTSFSIEELNKIASFLGMSLRRLIESAEFGRQTDDRGAEGDDLVQIPSSDPWTQPPGSHRRRRPGIRG